MQKLSLLKNYLLRSSAYHRQEAIYRAKSIDYWSITENLIRVKSPPLTLSYSLKY